ncbi:MAG: methyltransferase domain-containing protein [Pseudonocardia sp.]
MGAAERARTQLVDALRASGRVRNPAVEAAFRAVPRHLFLPGLPPHEAYADEAVAVQHIDGVATSSASQPSMMAIMLEQLDLRPGHRVLEVGAGTGYNAALMTHLVGAGGSVTAVDIDAELVARAADNLTAAGVSGVDLHCADGALGHPWRAPYDRIILTVGSADIRPEWVTQLAPGGRLLLPLSVRGSQLSTALDLGTDGALRSHSVRSCAFIRLRGVGAGVDLSIRLATAGLVLQPAGGPVDPAAVEAALADCGPMVPTAVSLSSADMWDGFGLYLALTQPGACRLLASTPDAERMPELMPIGTWRGTVALAGSDGLAAVVVIDRNGTAAGSRIGVRAFGSGGPALVDRLTTALDRWMAAGRPNASGLHILVIPRSDTPDDEPASETPPSTVVIEHYHIVTGWEHRSHGPPAPARTTPPREAPTCPTDTGNA